VYCGVLKKQLYCFQTVLHTRELLGLDTLDKCKDIINGSQYSLSSGHITLCCYTAYTIVSIIKKIISADPISFHLGQIFTTRGTTVMPLSIAAAVRVLLHRKSAPTRNLGTQFSYSVKLTLCPRRVSRSSIFLTYAGLLCGKAPMNRDTIQWTLHISLRIILILFFHLCLSQKLSLLFRFPF
jgi:hypothetical protein